MSQGFRSPSDWSLMARTVADATDRGIRSARAHDGGDFAEAVEILGVHADAARAVHAHMVRELIETAYQDGLDSDDVADVLTRTVADATGWDAPVDPTAVAVVLTGALGVNEPADPGDAGTPASSASQVIGAAILVAARLTTDTGVDHGDFLRRAVEEIRRAQTVEMP